MTSKARTISILILCSASLALASCGGDDLTGFTVRARVRGINIAAITELEVRFEASGSVRFDEDSGSESGVRYATEDGGQTFSATGTRGWVTDHYELSASEFVFTMPFANPEGGGEANLHIVIHRDVNGEIVPVGESTLVPVRLPVAAGGEVEAIAGCLAGGQCGP